MTIDLRSELARLAQDAGDYADTGTVLTRLGRRRRRVRGSVIGAAALAIVILAITVAPGHALRTERREPSATAPAPLAPPAYPPSVNPPRGAAPTLPHDRAVGQGALVYQAASGGGPAFLVLSDGTQYDLGLEPMTTSAWAPPLSDLPVQLSPDGRWLAVGHDGGIRVRDLLGTRVVELPGFEWPMVWSTDSRQLLRYTSSGPVLTDLADPAGASVPLPKLADLTREATAVLSSGIVLSVGASTVGRLYLFRGDAASHRSLPTLVVDGQAQLDSEETISFYWTAGDENGSCHGNLPFLSAGRSDRLIVGVFRQPHPTSCRAVPPMIPTGALIVSSVDGHVIDRVALPPIAGLPILDGQRITYPSQADRSAVIEIKQIDLDGGPARTVCRLPATAVFSLRGAAAPAQGPAWPRWSDP